MATRSQTIANATFGYGGKLYRHCWIFTEAEDEQALGAQLSRDSALFQYAEITWNILAARIRFRAIYGTCRYAVLSDQIWTLHGSGVSHFQNG